MADFKIVTDGAADLDEDILTRREITVVPFYVMLEGGAYLRQGPDISTTDFYGWMLGHPGLFPKSAAPSVQDYLAVFSKAAEAGEKVLCLCLTGKFSCSCQSARIARQMTLEEHPDAQIAVLDSTLITVLQGQLVLEACGLRDSGVPLEAAVSALEELKSSGRIYFTIGSMDYLRIGGRIGKLAGKVGSVLGIRPVIEFRDGEIHSAGVARGRPKSLEKTLNAALAYVEECLARGWSLSFAVGYGSGREEADAFCARLTEMLAGLKLSATVPIRRIGAVIGVHTGPLPLGVGILRRSSPA